MNARKNIVRACKWLGMSLCALLLFLALLFAMVQTGPGKRQIKMLVTAAFTKKAKSQVEIGELGGIIPFSLRLDRLALSDSVGEWLALKGITIRLSPFALLRGHLYVKEVITSLIQIHRLPRGGQGKETTAKPLRLRLPKIPSFSVEGMAIERLELGEALLGQPVVFRVNAKVMAPNPKMELISFLSLERTDAAKTAVVLKLVVKGKRATLTVDAEVEENSGGLFATALGIREPFRVSLHGEGPLQAWRGQLRAQIGQYGDLNAEVGMEVRKDARVTAKGTLKHPQGLISPILEACLGSETRFDLGVSLLKTKVLTVDLLNIETERLKGKLTGSLDLEHQVLDGHFILACEDLEVPGTLKSLKRADNLLVEGSFSGPLMQPQAALTFKVSGLEFGRLGVTSTEGNFRLGLGNNFGSPFAGIRLNGSGKVEGVTLKDSGPLPETRLMWQLSAEGPFGKTIRITQLKLHGEKLSIELSGLMDTVGPSGTVDAVLEIHSLPQLSSLLKYDLPGSVQMKVSFEGDAKSRSLSARVQGKIRLFGDNHPYLAPLAGTDVRYTGRIVLVEGRRLTFSEILIETLLCTITANGSMDIKERTLSNSLRLVVPQLDIFFPGPKNNIGGSLIVNAGVKGHLTNMDLTAEAVARDLIVERLRFRTATATLQTKVTGSRSKGHFSVALLHEDHKIEGMADFAFDGRQFALSTLSLKALRAELTGQIVIDLERYIAEGELQGTDEDLSAISTLFGKKIEGSARLYARFKAIESGQKISFTLEGKNVVGGFGQIGNLEFRGEIEDAFRTPRGIAKLEVKELQRADLTIASLALSAQGDARYAKFHGSGSGHYKEPLEIETSGVFVASPESQELEFERFQAWYGKLPLKLNRLASIKRSPNSVAFKEFSFNLGTGHLEISGSFEESTQTLDVKIEGLSLEVFQNFGIANLAGTSTGNIRLVGKSGKVQGKIALRLDGLGLSDPRFNDFPPAKVEASAELQEGWLQSECTLGGLTAKPFEASLKMPLNLSLSPFAVSLPSLGKLDGSLLGEIDLSRITAIIGLDDQSLGGLMEVDIALAGTVEDPKVRGRVRLLKGNYENVRSGTLLRDIELVISAISPRLQIERAQASDGGSGTISAQGWFDLVPAKGFPFSVKLTIEEATLLRHDDALATIGGELEIDGSVLETFLKGQLRVKSAEIHIPKRLPSEITELEVVEIHGVGQETKIRGAPKSPSKHLLKLDLSVVSPGKLFARGRGLDSEWQGELRVSGTKSEPAVNGKFSVVRGHFNFLGKRFTLKRGLISFEGRVPPSPQLDVLGESSTKDMIVLLQLSGPISAPVLELSSVPSLPSDEVLSHLLFGRSVSNISPVQAVQLAQAINVMAGGGGFDFLGRTRKLLGVDQLEVKQSGEDIEETTISAGKYLHDKIYLEVEGGIGSQSGKASVELEITPNISVETEVGANAEGGVGLNWKWDY